MGKSTDKIANALGADIVRNLPRTGGGAIGAARLGRIVTDLQRQLVPSDGKRPGRPTKREWIRRPKVPMSKKTEKRLVELARQASTPSRRISPMQMAARLLEEVLSQLPAE